MSTTMHTTPAHLALAASLVGRPYEPGALGPDAFYCWGLTRYWVREAHGVCMGDVAIAVDALRSRSQAAGRLAADEDASQIAAILAAARAGGWRPAPVGEPPGDGCILLLRHGETGRRHVGNVLLSQGVLHLLHCEGSPTDPTPGVLAEPLTDVLHRYHRPEPWRRAA